MASVFVSGWGSSLVGLFRRLFPWGSVSVRSDVVPVVEVVVGSSMLPEAERVLLGSLPVLMVVEGGKLVFLEPILERVDSFVRRAVEKYRKRFDVFALDDLLHHVATMYSDVAVVLTTPERDRVRIYLAKLPEQLLSQGVNE